MTVGATDCRISVAICTWNRSWLLRQTLEKMTELEVPAGTSWEIVVVDNNSTDDTGSVLRGFENRLPLRSAFEVKQGHSNARNRAVREARGEYIVWTDDDVLVPSDWLSSYAEAFDRFPDAVAFGGPIEPWFAGSAPEWLQTAWREVGSAWALRDLGPEWRRLGSKAVPYGANFALRADIQSQHPFDPDLGRRGKGLTGGDEVTVLRAIFDQGHEGWWVPRAKVRHYIDEERQTVKYLEGFFLAQGALTASSARDPESAKESSMLFGKPRWLVRAAAQAEVKYLLARLLRPPRIWVPLLVSAARTRGRLRGYGRAPGE